MWAAVCGEERCVTMLKTAARETNHKRATLIWVWDTITCIESGSVHVRSFAIFALDAERYKYIRTAERYEDKVVQRSCSFKLTTGAVFYQLSYQLSYVVAGVGGWNTGLQTQTPNCGFTSVVKVNNAGSPENNGYPKVTLICYLPIKTKMIWFLLLKIEEMKKIAAAM